MSEDYSQPFDKRHGPGIVLKYTDEQLRQATEELRQMIDRLRLERDYIRLFDQYLDVREELRKMDH